MTYALLNTKSHFSLLRSPSRPKQIVSRCKKLGIEYVTITDTNLSGSIDFYTKAIEGGLKPLLGLELAISSDVWPEKPSHSLILIAKNLAGWGELLRLYNIAALHENLVNDRPTLPPSSLAQTPNLIAISGGVGSELTDSIFKSINAYTSRSSKEQLKVDYVHEDWLSRTTSIIEKYKGLFGDNFYVGINSFNLDRDTFPFVGFMIDGLRYSAKKSNVKCVAITNSHYLEREDSVDQHILLSVQYKSELSKLQPLVNQAYDFEGYHLLNSSNFYIPSFTEVDNPVSASELNKEMANTLLLAKSCEQFSPLAKTMLPKFQTPDGSTSEEYIRKLCREGWVKREQEIDIVCKTLGKTKKDYGDRFKLEFDTLAAVKLADGETSLLDYFLLVHDYVDYSQKNGELTGLSARGSVGGCLIAYLLGITDIDPLEFDLLFARFYNAGRNTADNVSLPDIDIDFEVENRERTVERIKEKYGGDKVCQVATFGRMQGRSAIKDVIKAHNACGFAETNRITDQLPEEARISEELQEMRDIDKANGGEGEASVLMWALEHRADSLKEWVWLENGQLQGRFSKIFEQAIRLEGTKRSRGRHAAALIISPKPIAEFCPMVYDKESKSMMADMEYVLLELIGALKVDILGLSCLDKIRACLDLINGIAK